MAAPFQNYSGGVLLADIVKRNNLSRYVSEAIKERSLFIKSGAVARSPFLDAKEGGTRIQVPEFNPVSPTEEIMDGTASWGTSSAGYMTPQKIGTATQISSICHRGFSMQLMTLQFWLLVKIQCFTSATNLPMQSTS